MQKTLTAAAVEKHRPVAGQRRWIKDGGMPGLYLVVGPSGAKSYVLRFRARGGR
jgi:hypothetical protein